MKKTKEKLKWINEEYKDFESYDMEIGKLNELKQKRLENIISLLKQTDFLDLVKNIEGVKSAQLIFGVISKIRTGKSWD